MNGLADSIPKLVTYSHSGTLPRAGLAFGNRLADASQVLRDGGARTVLEILARWEDLKPRILATTRPASCARIFDLKDVTLHAPILFPPTVYCAGANYRSHARAMSASLQVGIGDHGADSKSWHFLKAPRTIVGTNATVRAISSQMDWEAELVAVIGRECADVAADVALDYIAGYTIANDLSARDRMRRGDQPESAPFRYDWLGHKSFAGSCPLGPWIVPACAIPDPQQLSIKLWVDERLRQNGNTREMIFTVAEQIAHLSQRMTLFPGDIILTGTPAGVGAESQEYLVPGNRVRIEVENVGELNMTVGAPSGFEQRSNHDY